MLYEVNGDLVKDLQYDIFCHQTNCKGVMGAGIAKQIKEAYPEVAVADREYYSAVMKSDPDSMLGTNLYVKTKDNRLCVNMYGQRNFGWGGGQKTDYAYIVGFPYGIGCGLGGGDWIVVRDIIVRFADSIKQDVYIVKKEKA